MKEKPAELLKLLGYKSSEADSNVCMKRNSKPNGDPYYKYMMCYVDNFFVGF